MSTALTCHVSLDVTSYDIEAVRPVAARFGLTVRAGRKLWHVYGEVDDDLVCEMTQALDDAFPWPKIAPRVEVIP